MDRHALVAKRIEVTRNNVGEMVGEDNQQDARRRGRTEEQIPLLPERRGFERIKTFEGPGLLGRNADLPLHQFRRDRLPHAFAQRVLEVNRVDQVVAHLRVPLLDQTRQPPFQGPRARQPAEGKDRDRQQSGDEANIGQQTRRVIELEKQVRVKQAQPNQDQEAQRTDRGQPAHLPVMRCL